MLTLLLTVLGVSVAYGIVALILLLNFRIFPPPDRGTLAAMLYWRRRH